MGKQPGEDLAPGEAMRVLVCGGRDFCDREAVFAALDRLGPLIVIHGGARGADMLAGQWAEERTVACMVFPAPWRGAGKAAGPMRNRWMLAWGRPDLVMAFPGGAGTGHMVRIAEREGIKVVTS